MKLIKIEYVGATDGGAGMMPDMWISLNTNLKRYELTYQVDKVGNRTSVTSFMLPKDADKLIQSIKNFSTV